MGTGVPRVEAWDAEGFEVIGVPCGDGHLCSLGNGGDEGVVERCMLGNPVGRENPRRRQVEGQNPVGERGQDVLGEAAAQDRLLPSVRSLLGDQSSFDLGDGGCRDELITDGNGRCPHSTGRLRPPTRSADTTLVSTGTSQLRSASCQAQAPGFEVDIGALVGAQEINDGDGLLHDDRSRYHSDDINLGWRRADNGAANATVGCGGPGMTGRTIFGSLSITGCRS